MQSLKLGRADFHSYSAREDRRKGFVVEGLPDDYEEEDVVSEMAAQHKLHVFHCYKMKGTRVTKILVTVKKEKTIRVLEETVRSLSGIRIFWSPLRNKREIGQCKNCQRWGHGADNCFAQSRCFKCAKGHLSKVCPVTKENGMAVKCANCSGQHTASNRTCPVYVAEVARRQSSKKVAPARKYVPAPPPARNAWTKDFPTLPSPKQAINQRQSVATSQLQPQCSQQTSSNPHKQQSTNQSHQFRPANRSSCDRQSQDDLRDIASELRQLREMVDLGAMLGALRRLRLGIQNCRNDPLGKLECFQRFAEDLDKF